MLIVMLMVMVVNILLLFAAGRFLNGGDHFLRLLAGSLVGALFAGFCMLPGFSFLGNLPWRLCSLLLTGMIAFGFSKKTVPKMLLFFLLHLSLGGIGENQTMVSMLLGAAGIGFACLLAGRQSELVPVELNAEGQTLHRTALRDTGNTLRDPITGKGILVVDARIAEKLTGLEPAALCDPVNTIGRFPGLRLIPYRTVGDTGFLLALQIRDAKIGNRQGSVLVALSPNLLGKQYQALTGGTL